MRNRAGPTATASSVRSAWSQSDRVLGAAERSELQICRALAGPGPFSGAYSISRLKSSAAAASSAVLPSPLGLTLTMANGIPGAISR